MPFEEAAALFFIIYFLSNRLHNIIILIFRTIKKGAFLEISKLSFPEMAPYCFLF